ncbi:hypothetical protein ASG42_24480 [Rhizobium sp. Leaf391]|uniref:hypothetical protein n=1 Tax=Rhizobium sp. Leaf391 TaxID=1736360 RepID=UPI00071335B4|nr:hypothetical protein [Rhizobium sp. Leaf391]KQT03171.1 hypothetical protein ASG42_24480 [Rhizobium sp. Leaf391]
MAEIHNPHLLNREAEAKLIDKLWHEPGAQFDWALDCNGLGKSPLSYSGWSSPDYPTIAIVLISIDTGSSAYRGSPECIEIDPFMSQSARNRTAFRGWMFDKVIRRYLVEMDLGDDYKWRKVYAAANSRFLADLFDPDDTLGLIRING